MGPVFLEILGQELCEVLRRVCSTLLDSCVDKGFDLDEAILVRLGIGHLFVLTLAEARGFPWKAVLVSDLQLLRLELGRS